MATAQDPRVFEPARSSTYSMESPSAHVYIDVPLPSTTEPQGALSVHKPISTPTDPGVNPHTRKAVLLELFQKLVYE